MLSKAKWLAKEASLRLKYMTAKECLFCKIVKGEIKSKFLYESDKAVAFNDINPVSEVHILIVPKRHIESVLAIGAQDGEDVIELFKVASLLARQNKLSGFRLAFNGGRFQHVEHLHMHLLAGAKIKWEKL